MTFQETIQELRAKKNISQKELARMIGVSPVQLSRYENGTIRPRLPILAKLAEVLDVDYQTLSIALTSSSQKMTDASLEKVETATLTRLKKFKIDFENLPFQEKVIIACHINNSLLLDVANN